MVLDNILDNRYDFLKDINLKELKGKDENHTIVKGIKFSKNERCLLQYITFKQYGFSEYVKSLILSDMRRDIEGIEKTEVLENKRVLQNEEYIIELIKKVLKEELKEENLIEVSKNLDEDKKTIGALNNLGIKKR